MDESDQKPNDTLEQHIQLDGHEENATVNGEETVQAEPVVEAAASPLPADPGMLKEFYLDLIDVLTEPRHFFLERFPKLSLTYGLTFGIVITWIAAFLDWLTRLVRHETLFDGFLKIREKLHDLPIWNALPDDFWAQTSDHTSHFPTWVVELLGIALSPFQSLAGFCISGFVLFLGAYLLVPKVEDGRDTAQITTLVKLICFASTPRIIASILGFLPFGLGALIGSIYVTVLTVIALQVRFKVSTLRAAGIMVLPGMVVVFALSCFIGAFAGIFIATMAALFGSH